MLAKVAPLLTVALVTVLLAAGCDGSAPTAAKQTAAPTRVIAKPLVFERQSTRVEAVGTSRAVKSVNLQPESSGEVVAINFQPGQRVAAGEVLVELDQRDEVLAVELARVRLREAERLFERYQQSAGSGAVLPTQIDAAETELDSARIELDQAKLALDHRTIEASFDGHVGITDIDAGDRVEPSTLITTLDDRSALLVTFSVPESLIADLNVGDTVAIATWRDRNAAFAGEIVDIGSRIDPQHAPLSLGRVSTMRLTSFVPDKVFASRSRSTARPFRSSPKRLCNGVLRAHSYGLLSTARRTELRLTLCNATADRYWSTQTCSLAR